MTTVVKRNAARRPRRCRKSNVTFIPDESGVESLARQIKMTGRAYPLFQIARLILQKPERYSVQLTRKSAGRRVRSRCLFARSTIRRG